MGVYDHCPEGHTPTIRDGDGGHLVIVCAICGTRQN